MLGKVIEVFIPGDNIIDSTKIGFKVLVDDLVIEIIQDQNVNNINILKDDLVTVTGNGDDFDISIYDGD